MKLKFLSFFFIVASTLKAQTGSWTLINTSLELSKNWSLFNELQLRSQILYDNFFYYEVKGGIIYKISKIFSLTGGLGKYVTYSQGGNFSKPKTNDEFRTWLQMDMLFSEKRLKMEHRYRVEQRWTSSGFRHRFRYRLSFTLPVNNKSIKSKTFYMNTSDEIFFTNRTPYFIRNRFYFGCGYQFTKLFALQTGWMQQFDILASEETNKGFMHLSILLDLDGKTKKNRM